MKNLLKKIIPDFLLDIIKKYKYRVNRGRDFFKNHGYELNIKDPKTFSEKLYYRKYYGNFDNMALFADKYKVRDYVSEKVGSEYLIPLLGVYKSFSHEDWRKLPEKFVLKSNHGSGANHLQIVTNKQSEKVGSVIKKFDRALKESFGIIKQEPFYARIDKLIIAEQYLESETLTPNDYKFHCFRDKIFIQVDSDRYEGHKRSIFDVNWNKMNFRLDSKFSAVSDCSPPENLAEMIEIAKKLSEDFDYIRVDLYNVNGKIYFGELTQTHGNGTEDFKPNRVDREWGDYWELDRENKELYQLRGK
ncbi:ATP-grasp fold amidoligase family protein [Shewanella sp. 30m-9]